MRDAGIFLTLHPGSGMGKIRIRDKHLGSATLITGMYVLRVFDILSSAFYPDPAPVVCPKNLKLMFTIYLLFIKE